jgi:hypothetical protein
MITLSSIFDKALNQGYWFLEAWETPSIFLEQFNIIYLLWHLAFDNHTSLFIVMNLTAFNNMSYFYLYRVDLKAN